MQTLIWKNLPALALAQDIMLKADWDRLNAQRGDLPFMSSDAVVLALQVFGHGNERLLVGQADGHTMAMLLVNKAGPLGWQTFQPSQIPLGAWVADAQLQLDAIAQSALHSGQLGLCLSFSITQVDPLFAPMAQDSSVNRHDAYIDTGWIEIAGSFEDYWATRGKNLRQNMRKQRNRLAADGVKFGIREYRACSDMVECIRRYGVLESAGWKAEQGTAIHLDNSQGDFYRKLLEMAAMKGEAVVFEYTFNEDSVAMNLCLQRGGTIIVLKTTYDETIKHCSPAFLLRCEELEALFQANTVRRMEFYGRFMEWHSRWTEHKRTLYHLTCYRWPWLKKLAEWRRADDPEVPPEKPPTNEGSAKLLQQEPKGEGS